MFGEMLKVMKIRQHFQEFYMEIDGHFTKRRQEKHVMEVKLCLGRLSFKRNRKVWTILPLGPPPPNFSMMLPK